MDVWKERKSFVKRNMIWTGIGTWDFKMFLFPLVRWIRSGKKRDFYDIVWIFRRSFRGEGVDKFKYIDKTSF